jgi:predicted RNA binding protein YcfA (HicA-like mRNA interferase family)
MSVPSNVDRRKFIRALRRLGFEILTKRGKGSHVRIVHPDDLTRSTTLPARDPIARGTLAGMLRELRLSWAELEREL